MKKTDNKNETNYPQLENPALINRMYLFVQAVKELGLLNIQGEFVLDGVGITLREIKEERNDN
jgi:hypothetical protein